MKAIWQGYVIAESEETIVLEDDYYFPPTSVNSSYLVPSTMHTDSRFGQASYFNVKINHREIRNAAWYYPHPQPAVANIKDYIAFWKGVDITE